MKVKIRFLGGPLDRQEGMIDLLEEAHIFFDERDRQIFVYVREDELEYVYDYLKSKDATERYDEVWEELGPKGPSGLVMLNSDVVEDAEAGGTEEKAEEEGES